MKGLTLVSPSPLKAIVWQSPKIVMARISSNDDAAMRVVGIPLATPYPYECNYIQDGTNTAGETAPTMNPNA